MNEPSTGTGLVMLALLVVLSVFVASTSIDAVGQGGVYDYRVETRGDGRVDASVIADLDDPHILQRYRAANAERIESLLNGSRTEPVYVQVTFARPVPREEARQMARSTSLSVHNYLMVGTDRLGEPFTLIINDTLETPTASESGPEFGLEEDKGVMLDGVMVIQGTIPVTEQGLGALAADSRVYLADTTAVEVQEALLRSRNLGSTDIESIGLPSPFWSLRWGTP